MLALALALVAASSPAAAAAGDEDADLAERLAAEGRCPAALQVVAELRAAGRSDARLLRLAGTCEVQLRRYDEAVATLHEALQLAPDDAESHLRLAIALYHAGRRPQARQELARAEASLGSDSAELLLYRGLLLLDEARAAAAAETLERARVRDPRTVEPVASYYAAVAWMRARDRQRAERSLARVEAEWPGTKWAEQAEQLRQRLAAGRLRRWARVRAGVEYDDDAVLLSGSAALPEEISSRGDYRGVWSLELGGELLRTELWSAGVIGSYSGAAYGRIDSFDSHYPALALWLDRRLDEATSLRLALDGGFAWVNGDPFLATQRASLSLLRSWGEAGASELYGRVRRDDYRVNGQDVPDGPGAAGSPCPGSLAYCGPPGLDERRERNRDGLALVAGLRHAVAVPALHATLRAGYELEHFAAEGREYDFDAHSVTGDVLVRLPWQLALDVSGVFTWRPFRHASSYPDPPEPVANGTEYGLDASDREERYVAVDLALARPLGRGVTASLGWRWERNESNAEVFDYRRQVYGVHLSWAFGH